MDDLGNILYILFAIAAVVFNIMRKGKQDKTSTPPPVDTKDPFEDIIPKFEQMFKPEEKAQYEPVKINIEKKPKKEPKPVLNDFEEKKKQIQARVNRIPNKKTKETLIEVEEISEPGWFNAREAIIYSEILKRPEF